MQCETLLRAPVTSGKVTCGTENVVLRLVIGRGAERLVYLNLCGRTGWEEFHRDYRNSQYSQ